nr:probable basic-leucine zipper transcription factor R [Ipomoea batatas]
MEDQCSPLVLPYFFQEEGIEELKHSLLYTTLELENTVVCARDEIAKKDQEIVRLRNLLGRIVKERDEAMEECRRLGLEKQLLRQQVNLQIQRQRAAIVELRPPSSGATTATAASNEDQSSDSEENNIGQRSSTPPMPPAAATATTPKLVGVDVTEKIAPKMPLPEKGKFLQAVMEAGPLLQTLLLAGPLPEWQHPPPQLNSVDIPPVTISPSAASSTPTLRQDSAATGGMGYFSKKRQANGACDSPSPIKYQKAVNHISSLMTTNIISAS